MGSKYSTESVSGYNATPPSDDGTVSEANKIKWSTIKTKLPDPLNTALVNIDSKLTTHFNNGPTALVTSTTLDLTHFNKVIQVSGAAVTLTLSDAATLTSGWYAWIISTDTTNTVTLARATAGDTINEAASNITIQPLQSLYVVVNAAGNGFLINSVARHSLAYKISEATTHTSTVTMSGKSMFWAKGADVASATALLLNVNDGNYFDVTGTTTVTSVTVAAGLLFMLQFDDALILTHHATNLNLPGGANITTAAGDRLIGFATGANTVHVLEFTRNGGMATIKASTSLPAANLVDITDIPQNFSSLILVVTGASSDTETRRINVQISTDNGSTFDSTASNYSGASFIATVGVGSVTNATLYEGQAQAAAQTSDWSVQISGYQAGTFPLAWGAGKSAANTETSWITYRGSTSAVNALRLIWNSTGNFDAGTYALFGVT